MDFSITASMSHVLHINIINHNDVRLQTVSPLLLSTEALLGSLICVKQDQSCSRLRTGHAFYPSECFKNNNIIHL